MLTVPYVDLSVAAGKGEESTHNSTDVSGNGRLRMLFMATLSVFFSNQSQCPFVYFEE